MITFSKDIEPTIKKIEELFGLSIKIFLATALVVIFLGVYVANLIYGNNSLSVLKKLQREKQVLHHEINTLKKENATLHKTYLEWSDAEQ
ncbi:MAG: hypothetical protein K0U38_09625 [Epsilonproteobacteria bacterium]|nr:hypothetical protein [Campylobacterota bacterium]